MTIKEAMKERHMVRKYVDKKIPEDLVSKLNERIEENNKKYDLSIKLMLDNDKAVNSIIKLLLAKGVKNYIILAGNDTDDLAEKLGYSSADIMLYAQTLGLNTWYVGGTFNRGVSKYVPNKKVIGIVAIGYGINNGVAHKSKTLEEVSSYDGTMPEWFKNGILASLLAPTALNKQDYRIVG
ncbi:MAG: nitroreductase, partial [Bacilli bacterium]|nr:nitroreductase [Bacilli bacterium]